MLSVLNNPRRIIIMCRIVILCRIVTTMIALWTSVYSLGADHKENTSFKFPLLLGWRHHWNGPQGKRWSLPLLRCMATAVNKRPTACTSQYHHAIITIIAAEMDIQSWLQSFESRGSSANIVSKECARRPGIWVRFPVKTEIYRYTTVYRPALRASCPVGTGALVPRRRISGTIPPVLHVSSWYGV
jgi:hypothetical protein